LLENILEDLIGEAFSVFPTTEDEISNEKIKELFRIIKKYPNLSINDPIVLDPKYPNTAKISRSLQRDPKFLEYLNNELDIELDMSPKETDDEFLAKFLRAVKTGSGSSD
jgi:translation initiation factor 2 beta subunit (eIF-2beta)/eIF-5